MERIFRFATVSIIIGELYILRVKQKYRFNVDPFRIFHEISLNSYLEEDDRLYLTVYNFFNILALITTMLSTRMRESGVNK